MNLPHLRARSRVRESMDDAAVHPSVLVAEYRFLARFNRVMGAAGALLAAIDECVQPVAGRVDVLDCGSGAGDIPRELLRMARQRPWACACVCTDSSAEAIALAAQGPEVAGLSCRVADVLRITEEFGRGGADVVHASLVLHHLGDEDVVHALRAMGTVARQLVVWNDLVRDRMGIVGARLSTLWARSELRRDAVVSVQRSFTLDEARTLAEAAGLCDIRVRRVRGARFVLTARPVPPDAPVAGRPLARAQDLSFSFGARAVLRGVCCAARSGELLRVTGPNGSGKSTLLACMAGALSPRSGVAWVDRTHAAPGYLPQAGGLFSALSAGDNLVLAATLAGVPRRERHDAVRDAAGALGIDAHLARPVAQLSGGVQRRVALACSTVHRPNVLIFDEPDAGLDDAGQAALAQVIARVLAAGGTALVASHTPGWAAALPGATHQVEVAL